MKYTLVSVLIGIRRNRGKQYLGLRPQYNDKWQKSKSNYCRVCSVSKWHYFVADAVSCVLNTVQLINRMYRLSTACSSLTTGSLCSKKTRSQWQTDAEQSQQLGVINHDHAPYITRHGDSTQGTGTILQSNDERIYTLILARHRHAYTLQSSVNPTVRGSFDK